MNTLQHDIKYMRMALALARRGRGLTSPNPAVGAVLVKAGRVIGTGWHRGPGLPHAEQEALADARARGNSPRGATLYVTLEPCSTFGRTPPCTSALITAGVRRVVAGTTDPNPKHNGHGFVILERAGIEVVRGVLEAECAELNEGFNHWIVHGTPFVTVKAAMSLDGKIATPTGESKWITGPAARTFAMRLRAWHDAVLVGINTVVADDPSLTVRLGGRVRVRQPWRVVLDALARTPPGAKLVSDEFRTRTIIVVSTAAPQNRVEALSRHVNVIRVPCVNGAGARPAPRPWVDLGATLKELGRMEITSVLVEGGGEVNAAFLLGGHAHRIAFFLAPVIIGGTDAVQGVAGRGVPRLAHALRLKVVRWRRLGPDMFCTGLVTGPGGPDQVQVANHPNQSFNQCSRE